MQQQALAARAAAQVAEAAADAKSRIMPWAPLPLTHDVFNLCQAQWIQPDLAVKGWALSTWTCSADGGGIAIRKKWRRDGGVANDAPGKLDDGGESSTQAIAIAETFGGLNQDALTDEAALRATYTLAQMYGVKMQLTKPPVMVAKETPDAPDMAPPAPWVSYPMTMDLAAPPWLEIGSEPFDQVTGLRIASIEYDNEKQVWTTKGTLYSMRDAVAASATAASDASGVAPTTTASPVAPVATVRASAPAAVASSVVSGSVIPADRPVDVTAAPAAGKPKSTDTSQTPVGPAPKPAPVAPLNPAPAVAHAATDGNGNGNAKGGMGALAVVQAHHNANPASGTVAAGTALTQAVQPNLSTVPPGVGN